MKTFKLKNIFLGLGMLASVGCTDLSETTYDIVPQDGFYQTKENVLQAFVRPFDTDIGCVVGRCIGLANFLPTII